MDDGKALLLALVRRKGSPHALADWLLERVPADNFNPADRPGWEISAKSQTLFVGVRFAARNENGVWLKLVLQSGRSESRGMVSQLVWIDLSSPGAGNLLAMHLNQVFLRRRKARVTK